MALSTASLDEVDPSASIQDSPLFRLPAELRVRIYQYVFESSEAVAPGMQTSLLRVSRLVKTEAIEVLYDSKTLRGDPLELNVKLQRYDIRSRVRQIEITEQFTRYCDSNKLDMLRSFLEKIRDLPRLQSTTILVDYSITSQPRWLCVKKLVQRAKLGPVTCIDIGRYQLHDEFDHIQLVHCKLVQMWPAVRDTPAGYDGLEEATTLINQLGTSVYASNVPTWASHTSLRCWVDMQQQSLGLRNSGKWTELVQKASGGNLDAHDGTNDAITYAMFKHATDTTMIKPIYRYPLLRQMICALKDIRPYHNANLLHEATDFLATNTVLYSHLEEHVTVLSETTRRPIFWAATWDSTDRTTLEYMAEQHATAIRFGASKWFVQDPSLRSSKLPRNLIGRSMFARWIFKFGKPLWLDCDIENATPKELQQLTHLHLALTHSCIPNSVNYRRRHDDWSLDLLRRYVQASGFLDEEEEWGLGEVELNDIRMIVSTALEILKDKSPRHYQECKSFADQFRRDTEPPRNLDQRVYAPLAWRFGKLLAQAFRRYHAPGGLVAKLASQWVKESQMWLT